MARCDDQHETDRTRGVRSWRRREAVRALVAQLSRSNGNGSRTVAVACETDFFRRSEVPMRTARELASEARSNHDAAVRALNMGRGLTIPSQIERLERFAADLEARAKQLDEQAASTAGAERG
jgi:hypothetical protein